MKRVFALIVVLCLGACGSGKEDDTVTAPTSTSVTDNDSCPVDISAAGAEEALAEAEEVTGGIATEIEDLSGLDQGAALRTFRVYLKDIKIDIVGCDNSITINDNDSDDDTTVDLGGQAQ